MGGYVVSDKLPIDDILHVAPPATPLVEAVLDLVREKVRMRLRESGQDWDTFVFSGSNAVVAADIEDVERTILDSGYRFDWSSRASVAERPDAYKPAEGAGDGAAGFAHPDAPTGAPDADGKALRGAGDNVGRYKADVTGKALYVRSHERVMELLSSGVPDGSIAIIDDSGGTLTAPIIDQFVGVICAGGSIRSHLGILTREYNIPCLMNAKVTGIREGDSIMIEATAQAKTTEDYQQGVDRVGRVWLVGESAQ